MEIEEIRMTVRLPADAVDYLDLEAKKEFTSRNAQIVRSIRERMSAAGEGRQTQAPAAENNTALPGGASSTQG